MKNRKRYILHSWYEKSRIKEHYALNRGKLCIKILHLHYQWLKRQRHCIWKGIVHYELITCKSNTIRFMIYYLRINQSLKQRGVKAYNLLFLSYSRKLFSYWYYLSKYWIYRRKKIMSFIENEKYKHYYYLLKDSNEQKF